MIDKPKLIEYLRKKASLSNPEGAAEFLSEYPELAPLALSGGVLGSRLGAKIGALNTLKSKTWQDAIGKVLKGVHYGALGGATLLPASYYGIKAYNKDE